MLRNWKPLVTEITLAEGLDRLVDEQAHHLGSCPKNRLFRTFGDISAKV